MTNIIKEFKNNLILSPDKIALYYGDNTTLSYKDLDAKSDYLASYLSLNGIKKNDNIFDAGTSFFFISIKIR